jgi:hypothetical protein
MSSDTVYVVVTWGSETERNCDILGVYLTKEEAVDRLINIFNSYDEGESEGNNEKYRIYLMNGFSFEWCDYYKITEIKIGDSASSSFDEPRLFKENNDLMISVYTNEGYKHFKTKEQNGKILVELPTNEGNKWVQLKCNKKKGKIIVKITNEWIDIDSHKLFKNNVIEI